MIRLIKFGIVGVIAAGVHLGSLYLLVHYAAIVPIIANMIAFAIAFCVSYPGQAKWTFADRKLDHKKSVKRFLSIQVLSNFIVNQSLFYLLLNYTSINYMVACFIVLITVAVITYALSFYWGLSSEHGAS